MTLLARILGVRRAIEIGTFTGYSALCLARGLADDGELRDIEQAINELPSGARHVFVLHAVYGYSHGETGNMLGIAEGTSKAQLNRARRLIVQQLEKTET